MTLCLIEIDSRGLCNMLIRSSCNPSKAQLIRAEHEPLNEILWGIYVSAQKKHGCKVDHPGVVQAEKLSSKVCKDLIIKKW